MGTFRKKQNSASKELAIRVYEVVMRIPKGRVTTYGQIGKKVHLHPRHVGRILHHNPDSKKIPCHRVVTQDGRVSVSYAFGGASQQRKKLQNEGVVFNRERVDMKKNLC